MRSTDRCSALTRRRSTSVPVSRRSAPMNQRVSTVSLLFAALLVPCVHAQTQRSGGEAQKFMQQYQQLAAEKAALQAQVAQGKKDLDAAQAALAAAKKERDALKARAAGS